MSISSRSLKARQAVPSFVYFKVLNALMGALTVSQIYMVKPEVLDPVIAKVRAELRRIRKEPPESPMEWWHIVDTLEEEIFDLISALEVYEDSEMSRREVQRGLAHIGSAAIMVVGEYLIQGEISDFMREQGMLDEDEELEPGAIRRVNTDDIADMSESIIVEKGGVKKKLH